MLLFGRQVDKYRVLLPVIFLQLLIIGFLIHKINLRFSLNTIQKKGVELKSDNSEYSYFYQNKANVSIKEKRTWDQVELIYNHNHDGLNNLNEYSTSSSNNTYRIAAIGDSFTYGLNVSTKDNWVTLLEKKLNQITCKKEFEVLNFGVPGYDVNYVLERNRLKAEKYSPDMYIWFIKDDDFSEPKELTLPIEQALNKSGRYSIDYYMKALETLYLRNDKQKIINEAEKKLFTYLNTHTQFKFLLVIPQNDLGYPTISDALAKELQSYANSHTNVLLVSVPISKDDIFYPHDYHFNEQGNENFSEIIFQKIEKQVCN